MGVMSHELRTPMNAVMSCALLLAQSKLDPVQRRTLGVLEDAGRQMLALLNDLLDLSSLNADKVRIEREPVSLLRLIEDAAVIWAAEIKAKGLSLSVMIDPMLVRATRGRSRAPPPDHRQPDGQRHQVHHRRRHIRPGLAGGTQGGRGDAS